MHAAASLRRWLRRTRGRVTGEVERPGAAAPPCGLECRYYELVRRMTPEERCEVAAMFRDEVASGWVPTAADLLAALDMVRHRPPGAEPGPVP